MTIIESAMARAARRGVDPRNSHDGYAREAQRVVRERLRREAERQAEREARLAIYFRSDVEEDDLPMFLRRQAD